MFGDTCTMNKKGKLAWEYLAAFVLGLLVVVALLLFSDMVREASLTAIDQIWETIFGF